MGHRFDDELHADVPASPQDVWDAIATGPGVDSWFMGKTEVDPGAEGSVRTAFAGYEPQHPITAWDEQRHIAYGGQGTPDGRSIAYEFLVEGREHGSTVIRMVTSGFLPGDDWADELDAMTKGHQLFFATLVEYLTHFAGRFAVPVTAFGPPVEDWDAAWERLHAALSLTDPVSIGDPVRFQAPSGLPVDGSVYAVNDDAIGVRSSDALYRFMRGFSGPLIAAHHHFEPARGTGAEADWRAWLNRTLS